MPIEAEMNSDGADDGGFYQSEDNKREQICSKMKKLKEAIECKVMESMQEAQDHYKRDYVKKHHTSKGCVMFVAIVKHCFRKHQI